MEGENICFCCSHSVTLPLLCKALQIQNSLCLTGFHLLQMIICDVMCVNTEIFVLFCIIISTNNENFVLWEVIGL